MNEGKYENTLKKKTGIIQRAVLERLLDKVNMIEFPVREFKIENRIVVNDGPRYHLHLYSMNHDFKINFIGIHPDWKGVEEMLEELVAIVDKGVSEGS